MEKLTQAEKIVEQKIDEATGSRYPAKALFALQEDGWIGKGEPARIINEVFDGWLNYALEMEALLLDVTRQLDETKTKLRAAELMVALRGRAA